MAGDYYNSSQENAANRAKVSPSIFSQIFDALFTFEKDIEKVVTGGKFQDRGSAAPQTTDILMLNSQLTPPAAQNTNVPENPELRNSHQNNSDIIQAGTFRFIPIDWLGTFSSQKPKLKDVFAKFTLPVEHFKPQVTERFNKNSPPPSSNEHVNGKKILWSTQQDTVEPNGEGTRTANYISTHK